MISSSSKKKKKITNAIKQEKEIAKISEIRSRILQLISDIFYDNTRNRFDEPHVFSEWSDLESYDFNNTFLSEMKKNYDFVIGFGTHISSILEKILTSGTNIDLLELGKENYEGEESLNGVQYTREGLITMHKKIKDASSFPIILKNGKEQTIYDLVFDELESKYNKKIKPVWESKLDNPNLNIRLNTESSQYHKKVKVEAPPPEKESIFNKMYGYLSNQNLIARANSQNEPSDGTESSSEDEEIDIGDEVNLYELDLQQLTVMLNQLKAKEINLKKWELFINNSFKMLNDIFNELFILMHYMLYSTHCEVKYMIEYNPEKLQNVFYLNDNNINLNNVNVLIKMICVYYYKFLCITFFKNLKSKLFPDNDYNSLLEIITDKKRKREQLTVNEMKFKLIYKKINTLESTVELNKNFLYKETLDIVPNYITYIDPEDLSEEIFENETNNLEKILDKKIETELKSEIEKYNTLMKKSKELQEQAEKTIGSREIVNELDDTGKTIKQTIKRKPIKKGGKTKRKTKKSKKKLKKK